MYLFPRQRAGPPISVITSGNTDFADFPLLENILTATLHRGRRRWWWFRERPKTKVKKSLREERN